MSNPAMGSYLLIRRTIGILLMQLPIFIAIGFMLLTQKIIILDSISEYYYTPMRELFTGTLFMLGTLLFIYRGYDDSEGRIFRIASFLCVLVAFFSMNPKGYPDKDFTLNFNGNMQFYHLNFFGLIHDISATTLFTVPIYILTRRFTQTVKMQNPGWTEVATNQKLKRNRVYIFCGWLILIGLLLYIICLGLEYFFPQSIIAAILKKIPILFCVETICLEAQGFCWLIKGEGIRYYRD